MNREAFYAIVRDKLGRLKQSQVDGFEVILAASDGLPRSHRAYILATAWHETAATMQPVRETLASTDQAAVNRMEKAWKGGRLKDVKTPYWRFDASGKTWLGRGYVQLTHRENYAKAAALTGVDLLGDPGRAMQPSVAAKILVEGSQIGLFTGKRLSHFLPGDYLGARNIINGTDKASLIADYAEAFERALQAAGVSEAASSAPSTPAKPQPPPMAQKPGVAGKSIGIGAALTLLAGAVVAKWTEIMEWLNGFGG